MSLLIFGKTGQVAQELARRAPQARFLNRDEADLSNPGACAAALRASGATIVINAAAYTAVDKAETDEAAAHRINAEAPGAMARAAAETGAAFIQISTDYVFDGSGTAPFSPDAPTAPIGAYGRSKLAGEKAVRAAGGVHAILRTSWVFSAHGANFVKTMLRLSESRDRLSIVADQVGGPTPAAAIAAACLAIGDHLVREPQKSGTYHFSGAPDVSWADFARAIFVRAGRQVDVADITTADYPTPARRPANSRLDCSLTEAAFGLSRPDWRAGLDDVLTELGVTR
ncbi:MAG: dTDP-4-dehydrorhamnose reductase [Limimaricola sp.]|uniref:dTDP-4-dehydrorhamnose reductase n=1 Tax=Limimaricola sp. TaxID=2211665 RepID=UPI001D97D1CC|nr:dTDP-4-dehydrorhamnose reductase [Limimaricola sp.]MBI1415660.1 dTDP-4-dehydrorhamnose reductase [Limimaricola sp.]